MSLVLRILLLPFLASSITMLPIELSGQAVSKADSAIKISFSPGTWLSGIDGSVVLSSSSLQEDTLDFDKGIEFKLSTQTGLFVKNNYNLGIRFEISSARTGGQVNNVTTEALFIGPVVGKYFSGTGDWAIAPELSVGYTSGLVEIRSSDPDFQSNFLTRSQGVSGQLGSTFLFMFSSQVGFAMNTRLNMGWIQVRKTSQAFGEVKENILLYDLGVSFGFRIFLDEFFF